MAKRPPKPSGATKDDWIALRVDPETKAAIKAAAEADGRSMSGWLVWVAKAAVAVYRPV